MSGNRRTLKTFTPSHLPAKSSSTYLFMPSTIETTAMRNITLMVTPSSVKKLLSFCTRIWARARRMASKSGIKKKRTGMSTGPSPYDRKNEWLQAVLGPEFGLRFVGRDLAVAEHDHPAGMRRDVRLVRHHDDRLALVGQ